MYFGLNSQFSSLIIGGAAGIVVGLIMELFLFSVDYSRSERFEYEDDEYHYYVNSIRALHSGCCFLYIFHHIIYNRTTSNGNNC